MGIWAGIKYAINSTVGTDKFKPLNELIIGQKSLCASDTIYDIIISSEGKNTYSNGDIIAKVVFNTGGSIKIKAKVTRGQVDVIKKSGTTYMFDTNTSEAIIPISANEEIQIKATNNSIIISTELYICASVEDTSLISKTYK